MPPLHVLDDLDDPTRRAATDLIEQVTRVSGHAPLADSKLVEIHGSAPSSGFRVVASAGDELEALAVAVRPDGPTSSVWNLQVAVAPDAGGAELQQEVTRRAVEEAWTRGASRVQWFAVRADDTTDRLALDLGLEPWRDLLKMVRPLPHPDRPDLPPGVALRSFRQGEDEDAWLDVNRRAFVDHPEQRTLTRADLDARMAEPWFDAEDFLVAEDADGMAGFCWVKIPGDGTGEIYVVGTDPDRQGRGLGRALVLAGMGRMVERGATTATLYTDGGNDRAVALYRALGYDVEHADRVYAGERDGRR